MRPYAFESGPHLGIHCLLSNTVELFIIIQHMYLISLSGLGVHDVHVIYAHH